MRMMLAIAKLVCMAVTVQAGPVLDAVKSGNVEAVSIALAAGGDVNDRTGFQTALISAIRDKNLDIIKLLLAKGADPDLPASSNTPLSMASSMGSADVVRLLLDAGADAKLARNSLTPLHRAAEQGCLECAKLLIAAGADNNALTSEAQPALHLAIIAGHKEVAEYLSSVGYTPPKVQLDAMKLSAADASRGQQKFSMVCAACHMLSGSEKRTGPPLFGVIGRDKASVEGFKYSDALKGAGGNWTYEDLNAFLASPAARYPGVAMILVAQLDESTRADLIAFLRTQHNDPPPLPN